MLYCILFYLLSYHRSPPLCYHHHHHQNTNELDWFGFDRIRLYCCGGDINELIISRPWLRLRLRWWRGFGCGGTGRKDTSCTSIIITTRLLFTCGDVDPASTPVYVFIIFIIIIVCVLRCIVFCSVFFLIIVPLLYIITIAFTRIQTNWIGLVWFGLVWIELDWIVVVGMTTN